MSKVDHGNKLQLRPCPYGHGYFYNPSFISCRPHENTNNRYQLLSRACHTSRRRYNPNRKSRL